jgi:hypothetical protein
MPLTLLAFHQLCRAPNPRRTAQAALAYGALLLTHNVIGLVFTPLLAGYVLFRLFVEPGSSQQRFARAGAALGAALLAIGIAAALLLPGFFERHFINQEQWVRSGYDYSQHFVQPFHLLSSAWGYAPGIPGAEGGMSFQLGVVPLILAAVATGSALRRPAPGRSMVLFLAAATLLIIFLMLPISAPLWELLPLAALIQFPWRLLALSSVTLAALSGFALPSPATGLEPKSSTRALRPQILALALVAVLGSLPFTAPQYTPIPESAEGPLLSIEFELEYTDMRGMTRWTEEMPPDSPLVAQYLAGDPLVTAKALAPEASLEMKRAGGASDEVVVRSPAGTALRFYTYYFPGWRVYLDGERLPDSALRAETFYGLLTVDVPPGEHHILLRWGDTPLRLAGKLLTLTCTALALILVALSRRPTKLQTPP